MPRVIHFDLTVDDPERARKFYEDVFHWKIEKWDGPMDYWMVTTGEDSEPGINGGFMRKRDAQSGTHHTISVSSVDEFIKKVEEKGGKIVSKKMAIPGVGWMAAFRDPEGNVVSMMEDDKSAK